ncbi:MAG: ABC transporter permease [Ancalomicrobiaceae bacterium]|nr:ABC transporter permease [Ancalomicrobiaceae bacterium]
MTRPSLLRHLSWETFLGLMTIAVLIYAVVAVPNFATAFNLSQAAAGISEKALIVFPMVLLIIAREIDLSVASILALCSVILGVLLRADVPMALAFAVVLLIGGIAGALNGALVAIVGLPSLVVTLGTLAMFRGIGYIILGTGSINQFPEAFTDFGIDLVPWTPIPWTIVPFLILAPIFAVVLQATPIGRRIYAIGGNPATALYSGIKTRRMVFLLFVLSGVICALAAIIFTARLSNARANNALGFELDVITATFLGGVSAFGGTGKITGVLWALVLLAVVRNVLGLSQIGGDAQGTVIGLLLILSLLLSNVAQQIFRKVQMRLFLQQTGE